MRLFDPRRLIRIAARSLAPRSAGNEMISEQRKGGPARGSLRFCMCVTGVESDNGRFIGFDARPGQQRRRLTYGSARNVGQEPAQARLDLNARRTRRPRKTR